MHIPFGFIYITVNLINGRRYIGQSSYSKPRWETYLGSGKYLRKAIKKYGSNNFERIILCEADTREELSELEIYFIKAYNAVDDNRYYNVAEGGYVTRGFTGRKHTQLRNSNLSDKMQGHSVTEKTRLHAKSMGKIFGKITGVKNLLPYKGGKDHPKSKEVFVNGESFPSLTAAHAATGISKYNLRKLLHT